MNKDRIIVFNRLTDGDSPEDASVFESLIGIHYDIFCYLYDIIVNEDFIQYVDDIKCILTEDRIRFKVKLNTNYDKEVEELLQRSIDHTTGINPLEMSCESKSKRGLILSVAGLESVG